MFQKKIKKFAERHDWRFERTVPLAFAFAVFLQSAAAVWWASAHTEARGFQDRRIEQIDARLERTSGEVAQVGERLATLEERATLLLDGLRRIEQRLGR